MCELMETIKYEGELEGEKRGIKALIESLYECNVDASIIAQKIMDKFSLSAEDANKLVHQYAPNK